MLVSVSFIIYPRRAAIVVRISIIQQFLESIRLLDVEEQLRRSFGISLNRPLVRSDVCVAIGPCE
jgi:hypothetical protein